jgi:hypothetical protein
MQGGVGCSRAPALLRRAFCVVRAPGHNGLAGGMRSAQRGEACCCGSRPAALKLRAMAVCGCARVRWRWRCPSLVCVVWPVSASHPPLVLSCLLHALAGRTFPAGERGSAAGSLLSSHRPKYTCPFALPGSSVGQRGIPPPHHHPPPQAPRGEKAFVPMLLPAELRDRTQCQKHLSLARAVV